MPIRMSPPSMDARPARSSPSLRPILRPARQMNNVTTPMISDDSSACTVLYDAVVNPTESASIDVATPCIISAQNVSLAASDGSSVSATPALLLRRSSMPSFSSPPPIIRRRISAIQGIRGLNHLNNLAGGFCHQQPSYHRHHELETGEGSRDREHASRFHPAVSQPVGNGHAESIHREPDTEQHAGNKQFRTQFIPLHTLVITG